MGQLNCRRHETGRVVAGWGRAHSGRARVHEDVAGGYAPPCPRKSRDPVAESLLSSVCPRVLVRRSGPPAVAAVSAHLIRVAVLSSMSVGFPPSGVAVTLTVNES